MNWSKVCWKHVNFLVNIFWLKKIYNYKPPNLLIVSKFQDSKKDPSKSQSDSEPEKEKKKSKGLPSWVCFCFVNFVATLLKKFL